MSIAKLYRTDSTWKDITLLIGLQFAMQIDMYIFGVPTALFLLVCTGMFLRMRPANAVVSRKLVYLGGVLVVAITANYLLNIAIIVDEREYIKSAAHLIASVVCFYIACEYMLTLRKERLLHLVYYISIAVLVLTFLLSIIEVANIADSRVVLANVRSQIYEAYATFSSESERAYGIAGFQRPCLLSREPTDLAKVIAVNIFIVSITCKSIKLSQVAKILLSILFIASGSITGSPIGLVASVTGVLAITFLTDYENLRSKIFTIIAVSICVAIPFTILLTQTKLPARVVSILSGNDQSTNIRFAGISIVLDVLSERPFSGIGFGQGDSLLLKYSDNEYLDIEGDTGVGITNALADQFIIFGLPATLYIFLFHFLCLAGSGLRLSSLYFLLFLFFSLVQGAGVAGSYWVPLGLLLGITAIGKHVPYYSLGIGKHKRVYT